MLDSVPGTLMLTDCLEQCQTNDSCSSVNYETGLCILFSSNADKLPGKLVGMLSKREFFESTRLTMREQSLENHVFVSSWINDFEEMNGK